MLGISALGTALLAAVRTTPTLAVAPVDEILVAGNFKVDIEGCPGSSADCVTAEVDPIEIEMHDVTQSSDGYRILRPGALRFGEARFTFRVSDANFNKDLTEWQKSCGGGTPSRRRIVVTLLHKDLTPARTFVLHDCFPILLDTGDYTAAGGVAIASLRVRPTRVELA